MAKVKLEVPELQPYLEIPAVTPGVMAHSRPYVAKPEHQEPLGFPGIWWITGKRRPSIRWAICWAAIAPCGSIWTPA